MYVADESDDRVYTYNMPDAFDARLASLALSGVDIGEFDSRQTEYEGTVADGVTETTVAAEAVQLRTTVTLDPPDADGDDANGHQVDLGGVREIAVTVTSPDGSRERVYRVTIEIPSAELELSPTWTSVEWPGVDGVPIADALRDGQVADSVVVIYEWNDETRVWLAFFPDLEGVPGINTLTTLTTLNQGRTYWVATAEPVTWTVVTGRAVLAEADGAP